MIYKPTDYIKYKEILSAEQLMKTCLIVDDSTFDRTLLKKCVAYLGFFVSEASNGKDALAICRTQLPQCILIDWEMKGMNGIELLEQLRALEGGERLRIIICTSHEHASFIGHAYTQAPTAISPSQ
jgi:two-component system chemotaxis response regulator CheY